MAGSDVVPLSPTFQALKALEAQAVSVAGPVTAAGLSQLRAAAGLPDCAVTRQVEYKTQRLSVTERGAKGYQNTLVDYGKLINSFHQRRLVVLPDGYGLGPNSWAWLKDRLSSFGIDLALPGEAGAPPDTKDWLEIVRMAATAAPLDYAVRQWQRTRHLGNDIQAAAEKELEFHLRRDGISRQGDIELIKNPYVHWSDADAQRLAWLGLIDETTLISLQRAAGTTRDDEQIWKRWLEAEIPDARQLVIWAQSALWDQSIVDRYSLDERYANSPNAQFWASAQGLGKSPGELPGQPSNEADWLRMEFRAEATLPSFGESLIMQRRFRQGNGPEGQSVVAGVPTWTEEDTINMLRTDGYTTPVIERLLGLAHEPLSARVVNWVLTQSIKHPEMERLTDALYLSDVDWVENAFLDQGHRAEVAALLATAARHRADEQANAEMYESLRAQRKAKRELAKRSYLTGILSDVAAGLEMQDQYFTGRMAQEEIEQINKNFHLNLVETQIAEIRKGYMSGKISIEQADVQLTAAGIVGPRRVLYVQEWVWERNESLRVLSTEKTLAAVKAGLMSVGDALIRMTNLGWSTPDALVELAGVQQVISRAAAKADESAAAKHAALAERMDRKAFADAKAKADRDVKAAAARVKAERQAVLEPWERESLKRKYEGQAFLDLHAYNAAASKNDDIKAQAEIAKAAAAYAAWLVDQLKLGHKTEDAGNVATEIDTERIGVPGDSKGDSGDAGADASSSDAAPNESSGPGAPQGS